MFGYIYITTNKVNDKIYIGQHKSQSHDKNYLGSGTILKQAVKKYGEADFSNEILLECDDKEELDIAEKYFIKHYKELGYSMYNIAEGGDGIDSELASQLAKERWSKTTKEERVQHMSATRKAYFEKYPRGLADVMKNHICPECGSPTNSHKKECSHYVIRVICSECGGKQGQHFSTCSQFKGRIITEEHKRKLSIAAQNRPPEYNEKISNTLKEKWKDPNFAEQYTCLECGGKSNNHKKGCSKAPHCPECGSQGHTHKKGCSKYKPATSYTCEVCGRTIKSKGNLKQHMAAHERRGEC